MNKKERVKEFISHFSSHMPDAKTELNYTNVFELTVAVILSAQCTDKRVNMVAPKLFKKYRSIRSFAYCDVNELSKDIRSTGYHNQKARSIQGASLMIIENFKGKVPSKINDLLSLPGVGRKTANCVLGTVFGVPAVVVDTHMIRIMNLLKFTMNRDPVKIESDVMKITNEKFWVLLTHLIIEHGRNVCIARRPKCDRCSLNDICPSAFI